MLIYEVLSIKRNKTQVSTPCLRWHILMQKVLPGEIVQGFTMQKFRNQFTPFDNNSLKNYFLVVKITPRKPSRIVYYYLRLIKFFFVQRII